MQAEGYQEVTASFMDAYRLDTQQFAANEEELQESQWQIPRHSKQTGVR